MNVIGYTRVSTDGQLGDDRFGLEAQKQQIIDYCNANGHKLVRWFSDEGESGAKERPGFDEIIYGEIDNPPYEAVVVAKNDRVARDINIYFYYKMMLRKKNLQLISIAEDFGQFGDVMSHMLEAFTLCVAEMERDNITKRTSGGRRIKAASGGYSGGNVPMGYVVRDKQYVIDEPAAEIVRRIFRQKKEGRSLLSIATELNKDGIKTRSGGVFYASSITSILANERTYRGEYRYGKSDTWVKGQHEPILKD